MVKFQTCQILCTEEQHLVDYNTMSKLKFTETKLAEYNSEMNLSAPISILDKGINLLPLSDLQNAREVKRMPDFLQLYNHRLLSNNNIEHVVQLYLQWKEVISLRG